MSQIDRRIKVNTIIENQLPEFILSDFPNAVEFFKQYYISQEFQGGPSDLIGNFDQYLKVDNLVPEVIVGTTVITSDVNTSDTTISVTSTKGFPDEYGLLKIGNEIITYTEITPTSFIGCVRGFSGITGYNVGISSSLLDVNKETLTFEDTNAQEHVSGSTITNLSVLFLQEFYRKIKKTFLPGLEDTTLASNLDVGNFVKFARSFYQSKGIQESISILFKVLYGVTSTVVDLEGRLIKPSDAEFIRREVIVAELITPNGTPKNLIGQTIFKSNDLNTNGSVSEVEVFTRNNKTYYKISLFVGFSDRDLIKGIFTVTPNTKSLNEVSIGGSIINVDSTVGFGATGTLISGNNTINYTSKSINQFFGCTGVERIINTADNIRKNESIFGYENGELSKRIDLRVTGVTSELEIIDELNLAREGENVYVKNIGEKILNDGLTYKEKFANVWKYNTSSRFRVEIVGSTISLKTDIDKASLKKGDKFQVLRRNEQTVEDEFIVATIDTQLNQITTTGLSFAPNPNEDYDIRRVMEKATSSGVNIKEGNEQLFTDVLNVYTDNSIDGYVASNSLPSYDITGHLTQESAVGIANTTIDFGLDTQNPLNNLYYFINFNTNRNIKFLQGDAVIYNVVKDPFTVTTTPAEAAPGLVDGQLYYVDPQPEPAGADITRIALHFSRAQIGTASTIQIGVGASAFDQHRFTLQRHADKQLSSNQILRKFPLSQNLFVSTSDEQTINEVGILKDGVEIISPVSPDTIFYGPLQDLLVSNGGEGYDVFNPPVIEIEAGLGKTALAEPILSGEVEAILVDPQDFDIESVTSISLTGGNGSGCLLEPSLGDRFREIKFDSRDLFFGGGIDKTNETITFTEAHNLENGQIVYYRNNGNTSLGIGAAYDANNIITGTLSDGDPYFVKIVNPTTVQIFNNKSDALSGINTVGLSTDTAAAGIHLFRTESKNTIFGINVIDSGSGYQYRKLRVNSSGISTSYNTINYVNHGFAHGDIINYSPTIGAGTTTPVSIQGLTTTSSYYVMKIDDDTFKLADAGIGATDTSNFDRGKVVSFGSTGTGYQTFTYPEIKVNIEVSYGSTVTGTFNFTPIISGTLTGTYLYEQGTDYGSTVINHVNKPSVNIRTGKGAELRPVIANGKVEDVIVVNQGSNYVSQPLIKVNSLDGLGSGAVVRSVIENGKITDAVVINSGIGYSTLTTEAVVEARGKNAKFEPVLRSLTLNDENRFGSQHLVGRDDKVTFGILGYSQELATEFESESFTEKGNGEFNEVIGHSPIIGWAYDGNPIYGPFGYTKSDDINSGFSTMRSSYKKDISKVENRPSGFDAGFFNNDYIFDNSGDLDIHNGRFCKTPEFPNGIYAYFATTEINSNGFLTGSYPYFIGSTYRLPIIKENLELTHAFDFNNSNLSRNTFPYNLGEEDAEYDFIIESNEEIRQSTEILSVSKGGVEDIQILNAGTGYKVGDVTDFDNTDTNGSGFSAEVSEILGIGISNITTTLERFENVVFTWNSSKEIQGSCLPFFELNSNDSLSVSGLSTTIRNLTDTFVVGVKTDTISIGKSMNTVSANNSVIEDIFVNQIPNTVSVGGSLRVGDEFVKILSVYNSQKVIRVQRNIGATAGVAHTFGSNVDVLNNRFTIPVSTKQFTSRLNDVVYFNAPQSVGVGTSGGATDITYYVGETEKQISISNRQIYLPNHPFTTGQKVTLNVPPVANKQIDVATVDDPSITAGNFSIPYSGNTIDLFVIKKSENFIGLSTVGIGSDSDGLFFRSNASNVAGINTHLYYFTSTFDQVTGDVDKVTSTVLTNVSAADTTTHGLEEGDIVAINVVPSLEVGIGTTAPVTVKYNHQFDKLLINPISFTSSDVEANRIDIANHGFKTGDKVFHDGGNGTGIATGLYFVNRVNDRYFQLAETLKDLSVDPVRVISINPNTGGNQTIAPVNPRITVVKNSKLAFGLTDTSLVDFDFKIYYDKNLTNEYSSSQDSSNFNVVGVGTVGIGSTSNDSKLTVSHTSSSPSTLYYGLSKGGFISTSDTDVVNYSEITFIDSIYNGEYEISGVTSERFNFSPKLPEFLNYQPSDCEKLEYSTKSRNTHGGIKNFKILSSGFNYKKLPTFKSVKSTLGQNANINLQSKQIAKIKDVRIIDYGYEYSADKTLRPEALIPSIVNIDNLDVVETVNIIDGGSDLTSAPNLLLFNPETNVVVDNSTLNPIFQNQTISNVEVIAPINGLDSTQHRIISINNSNGVGINSIETSPSGIVTCFLETPFNGFSNPQPFAVGDEVYVEGIQRVGESGIGTSGVGVSTAITGDGFNSENYNYSFFPVVSYTPGTTAELEFSIAGLTTNPGIAKTFQSGFASIINKKIYPNIIPVQTRGQFARNESVLINGEKSDLIVVEIRDDYIKLDGVSKFSIGDRITGLLSGVSAQITSVVKNIAKFNIDYANRQEYGWIDGIGKLNDDTQVIADNDYYQNLSYTVKSPITWDKFSNPLNRLVHPAGLKNFADTSIQTNVKAGIDTLSNESISTLILDFTEQTRVDAVNNFDFGDDYDIVNQKSKNILLSNRKLTDFTRCLTNRVLIHDDISSKFSSVSFSENSSIIDELLTDFATYLIQIIDPDTFDTQISEVIVMKTQTDNFLIEKSTDSAGVGLNNQNTNLKLGEIKTETTTAGDNNLIFVPVDAFDKDHDIKVLKTFFNTDILSTGSKTIGSVKLTGANVGVGSTTVGFTTTSVAEFSKNDFNGLFAKVFVQDSITKEINYNEVLIDFDGSTTAESNVFVDSNTGANGNVVGLVTARFENDLIKIQVQNDRINDLDVKAHIVGLGTTTAGSGVHRFLTLDQPPGSERSVRLESEYNTGTTSPITYTSVNKDNDSTIKSIVRVSCGDTSAVHQIVTIRDADDVMTVQYPFISIGSTSGIGTFGGEINGSNIDLKFYPDSTFLSLVEVQAFNEIFYTATDFDNTPNELNYGSVQQEVFVTTFDGRNGNRANKTKFDLKYQGVPIYTKTFNPDGVGLEKSTGIFTINNHFFNTNEEITYQESSTFVGVAATPVSIGSTINFAGINTTLLPTTVFVKNIDENRFQLFPTREDITSGTAITFTGSGSGNAHKLSMTQALTKTIIGLDGVTQQPISFTSIAHTLSGNIGAATSQFALSGIGSIFTTDVLKIDDEYMKIEQVGFTSTADGSGLIDNTLNVSLGISTIPSVRVERGVLGIPAASHSNGATVRVHRGSFNIVDSSAYFIEPPKGNTRERKTPTELPFVKADFSGRTFLRQNYTTNMIFDDISDNFTGIGKTYSLTVGGANTSAGIQVGNGVLFINGVFQTPFTSNNAGHNYKITADTVAGLSTVNFTGITSENGQLIVSESDINQNQVPRGGLIVSLGSTPGLGYAPLVGARVHPFTNSSGAITSLAGIGTTSGVNIGIETAVYDNVSGIITVTTEKVHGFSLGRPNSVHLKDLEFVCPKTVVGQPTNATYDGVTGISTITIANHGLVNGDAVILDTGSICFRCSKDSFATVHCYPRATDPAAGQYLTVSNVTTNTFRVNVGASNPGDVYDHQFESATATAVKTIGGGGYVGVTTTIFQDHERPLFVVGIVSERTFEVKAGTSTIPHTYQGGGNAIEFFDDLTFGSGYRGTTVAIGVTDINFLHEFVSSSTNSIAVQGGSAGPFTPTDAIYESHTGQLTLIIPGHGLTTSNKIRITTNSLLFKCSKDGNFSNHPYPRATDPAAGVFLSITAVTTDSITVNVGAGGGGGTGANITATVGVGGTLIFNIAAAGSGYINPQIDIPEPSYENLEVVGISRIGIGTTTDTGSNLLLNVAVSGTSTVTGIGSTYFEINKFEIARSGHSFKKGDKFKPVGLVTALGLSQPIQEFELEVLEVFNDKFSAWQFGELDYIDSIKILQDGERRRFPLFFNGELLSFEKDLTDTQSQLIDLNAVLLIFVNGVLQKPNVSYQFEGGSTFTFLEAPRGESQPGLNDNDDVDIFFYKGTQGEDTIVEDIQPTVKIGDTLKIEKNSLVAGMPIVHTSREREQTRARVVKDILNTDLVETDIYSGIGIVTTGGALRPITWTKQKRDLRINGTLIDKSRSILEPQVYATSKIIGDLSTTDGKGGPGDGIFVDNAESFFKENNYSGITVTEVDALITSGEFNVGAAATAIVSAAGTISSLTITEPGSGYSGTVEVKLSAPSEIGVGIGTTATATVTVSNGVIGSPLIVNPGLGYTHSNPPGVIIQEPEFKTEKITRISNAQGYTGIITGISQVNRGGVAGGALKFFFHAVEENADGALINATASELVAGYPIIVKDTKVGNGVTSVNPVNSNVVSIGTTFVDNIYIVNSITTDGSKGICTCHVHSNSVSSIAGIGTTGSFTSVNALGQANILGTINWGVLYGSNLVRSSSPISIGVTGLTVNTGLTTFPTIQRKSYDKIGERGHRSSGSYRAELA